LVAAAPSPQPRLLLPSKPPKPLLRLLLKKLLLKKLLLKKLLLKTVPRLPLKKVLKKLLLKSLPPKHRLSSNDSPPLLLRRRAFFDSDRTPTLNEAGSPESPVEAAVARPSDHPRFGPCSMIADAVGKQSQSAAVERVRFAHEYFFGPAETFLFPDP
jgi:hypothetical protein